LPPAARREVADALLHDPRASISEVAFLLGFADSTSFHRSFKRWTGRSPGDARRAGRSERA
jgi:AraC-like DNA-binding protein